MGRKTKKSDESDGGGKEGCELASQASNNSAHGEMKQRIMQLAQEKGPLMYRGAEIHIYADYNLYKERLRLQTEHNLLTTDEATRLILKSRHNVYEFGDKANKLLALQARQTARSVNY
ncbi:hypothetical protein F7725_027027 [Dissostichus mawsoni]|uniref:Uncharacterized protein n=1 Tax=Dissostichus mawsoni TaxID=36200 RepID=A0A7J5X8R9_DISMA|nr:hypothetical protein F7725_027027 [Dissostichus mawsoni]